MQILETLATLLVVVIFIETTYLTVMKLKQRSLKVARGSILLDTCSIMDGRIVDIAKTGIITAEIIIPRSVVHEMQLLADKADHEKRVRARRGLDNIRELQKLDSVSVTVVNDGLADSGGVDERLLELAQRYSASIATTDYNLNKVARVFNVTVINVNELAQVLRAQLLPGETTEIQLLQAGANREQGVGYLEDGTMVVVEDAKSLIGQKVKVEIVRSLQTEAGRMMFAKRVNSNKGSSSPSSNQSNSRQAKSRNIINRASNHSHSKVNTTNKQPATAQRVKTAPAFHSDQIKESLTTRTSTTKPRRTQKDAEADMVKLANS